MFLTWKKSFKKPHSCYRTVIITENRNKKVPFIRVSDSNSVFDQGKAPTLIFFLLRIPKMQFAVILNQYFASKLNENDHEVNLSVLSWEGFK
jgi:hypothetical protein